MRIECDFLVIGGGVAGLTFAIHAQQFGQVVLATKRSRNDSATSWAQGGIAAVLGPDDSFASHGEDTLEVACGLAHPEVVESVVKEGPERVAELLRYGVAFSRRKRGDTLDLTREGGHSARRVVHAGDITGREVQRRLLEAALESGQLELLEDRMAIDLIDLSKFGGPKRIVGAYLLDEASGQVHTVVARSTVLATGGAGKVYLFTSNPDVATGDGVAMAYRAGAQVANMEFFQFHPTALYHGRKKNFLISEALRGEGGVLRLPSGQAFMARHHPKADLAPRDVVARAIDYELKRSGCDHALLDMSARSPRYLRERFPNIHEECLEVGIDLTQEPIPVVPAAHYMCGGIVVNQMGKTTLPGLWAVGECSCTGLHGANRLASNSLLEGLVYGHRAAYAARLKLRDNPLPTVPPWDVGQAAPSDEAVVVSQNWDELRRTMWNFVGIVRSDKRLRRAARRIALLREEIRDYYWEHLVTRDLLELRNIAELAELIVMSAAFRRESRGLHYTLDHRRTLDSFRGDTTLVRGSMPFLVSL